jgi:hypothetical protein
MRCRDFTGLSTYFSCNLAKSRGGVPTLGAAGNQDDAFKFAVAWQRNAIDDPSRDAAAAYVSRLRVGLERRDAASAAAVPAADSSH